MFPHSANERVPSPEIITVPPNDPGYAGEPEPAVDSNDDRWQPDISELDRTLCIEMMMSGPEAKSFHLASRLPAN